MGYVTRYCVLYPDQYVSLKERYRAFVNKGLQQPLACECIPTRSIAPALTGRESSYKQRSFLSFHDIEHGCCATQCARAGCLCSE